MRSWVMEWVVLVRPMRIVAMLGFILGCLVSNRLGLGPVFVLVSWGCLSLAWPVKVGPVDRE